MNRRNFVRLSAAASAALLFSRLTYASGIHSLINEPDEVWAQAGDSWLQLAPAGAGYWRYKDIAVQVKPSGNASRVSVQSPETILQAVRLKWKHDTSHVIKTLGDHWERIYGNAAWVKPGTVAKNPWYLLLFDGRSTACFGVKTGCNALCWWGIEPAGINLTMDTHSGGDGVHLGHRTLHAADIVTTQSTGGENPFYTARRFCTVMCEKPRLPKQPIYGINDWYYAYGANSPALIKEQATLMSALVTDTDNLPFCVIDAGWAKYSPYLPNDGGWADDFSKPNDKFKDMHVMGDDIKKLGMRPGLWMRPLCAHYNDKASLLAPKIKGRDDPKNPVLDPTIPENIERVKNDMAVYRQWGYQMVKHDFSTYDITGRWGMQMTDRITVPGWSFYDNTRTTAEIINHLYRSIREAAGDMYIIGCNTMSHLSAGLFEQNRIGDDTSGREWARTRKMGVNALGFRMVQHNTFYSVDGDCVGLTSDIPWEKNKQWMQLLAESSAPLFISAQPDAVGPEQKAFIKDCFAKAAKPQTPGEPLDWLDNPLPSHWKLDGKQVDFNWS